MKRKHLLFLLFILIGVGVRFANLREALYFTYDQGRDAFAIGRIVQGDLTLIGPTTGLEGFFTGPLWYYAGVPGYILGNGNPYVISAWYVFLASLALPLYWVVAHRMFADSERWAIITAYFLALVPGSITASLQIWNPLLLLPLIALCLWLLLDARRSRAKMVTAFFLLGLGLHAEFASVLFLLAPLYVAIFWLRGKFDWQDYVWAGAAVVVTLFPQLIFDLRNDWLLTRSLLRGVLGGAPAYANWSVHVTHRIGQLFGATSDILTGSFAISHALTACLLFIVLFAAWSILQKQQETPRIFAWRLVLFLALAPYPIYLFWRGNNGYFWNHYLTSQFLFLVLAIVYGAKLLVYRWRWAVVPVSVVGMSVALLSSSYVLSRSLFPQNTAGLAVIDAAANRIFNSSETEPITVLIYTPNVYIDQYRYVLNWHAQQRERIEPHYERGSAAEWFVLIEPDYQIPERMQPWYNEATKSGELVDETAVGHLTLERWRQAGETRE